MKSPFALELNTKYMFYGYGIGEVKNIYEDNVRGKVEDFAELFFETLNMTSKRPLEGLKYRLIVESSHIKELLKKNKKEDITLILKLSSKAQSSTIKELINSEKINEVIFGFKILEAKKHTGGATILSAQDDKLYKQLLHNLVDEILVTSTQKREEVLLEIRQLVSKHRPSSLQVHLNNDEV